MESTPCHEHRIAAETLRAKELEAHGQLTRHLQTRLDSHRNNEKELQLTIAKERAEKCRIQAEYTTLRTKYQNVENDSVGREQRHDKLVEDFRQRLLTKEQEIETLKQQIHSLTVEKAEAAAKLTEQQGRETAHDLLIQRVTSERDDAKQMLLLSTQEIARLTAELSKKQTEIDAARSENAELVNQLEQRKNEVLEVKTEAGELSRAIERLEISRLRLAGWKQSRWAIQRRDLLLQTVFLEWKMEMLKAKAVRTHQANQSAIQRLQRVKEAQLKLSHRLLATKVYLQTTKAWLQTQERELRDWMEQCTNQFGSLVANRLNEQLAVASREHSTAMEALQQEMHQKELQHSAATSTAEEATVEARRRHKDRVVALVGCVHVLQQQKLRSLAFQGWKDVYLRNVIAQTTHAVMVARAAASLAVSPRISYGGRLDDAPVQVMAQSSRASLQATSAELRQPQLTIDAFAREAEEDQWRRWRRVTPPAKIPKQLDAGSGRSSTASLTSAASTAASHKPGASKSASIRREAPVDSPDGSTARRRASIV